MQPCKTKSVVAVLLLLASFLPTLAQTNTTSLAGDVQDASGAAITGSLVILTNPNNGLTQTTQSGKSGQFSFNQIPPGKYTVTVRYVGFSDQVQKVELLVNSPAKTTFKLAVGASEVVNVETSTTAVNTSDGSLVKPFNSVQIQTLPYLANNVLSLLALQPGVLSFDATNSSNSRGGFMNGPRQDQTNITLDGVDDNDQNQGLAFTGVLRSTRDSVEEFRVVTTGANADSRRSSRAQVSLITRSGTNGNHGSAYYYYGSPALAAYNWFLKQTQEGAGHPNIATNFLQDT